jgi:homoserine trans-succinylase
MKFSKFDRTNLNALRAEMAALLNKYGVEKVTRANKVEELYNDQSKDVI